jgi:hypothetical protein
MGKSRPNGFKIPKKSASQGFKARAYTCENHMKAMTRNPLGKYDCLQFSPCEFSGEGTKTKGPACLTKLKHPEIRQFIIIVPLYRMVILGGWSSFSNTAVYHILGCAQ